jgi:hypothetical protein
MSNMQFDPEVSRQIESVYTTPDVIEQRRVVRASLALRPGDRADDLRTLGNSYFFSLNRYLFLAERPDSR